MCLRGLKPLSLFMMLANHACVAACTSAVLYALWHANVRGDGHGGTCDLIGYCLFARVNAGSARNQSFVTTAETAVEWACLPARSAERRRGWGVSREQVKAKFCFRLRSCCTLGDSKVQVYEQHVDGRYGGLTDI